MVIINRWYERSTGQPSAPTFCSPGCMLSCSWTPTAMLLFSTRRSNDPGHPRAATDRSSWLRPARQQPPIGRGAPSQAAASSTWTSVLSNRPTVRQGGLSLGLFKFNCTREHPQVTSRSHQVRSRRSGRWCSRHLANGTETVAQQTQGRVGL